MARGKGKCWHPLTKPSKDWLGPNASAPLHQDFSRRMAAVGRKRACVASGTPGREYTHRVAPAQRLLSWHFNGNAFPVNLRPSSYILGKNRGFMMLVPRNTSCSFSLISWRLLNGPT